MEHWRNRAMEKENDGKLEQWSNEIKEQRKNGTVDQ